MSDSKPDRRVQRTRQLLQDALMSLIHEKGYDAITIQDITERANLGRTTFYLHYQSKDDLLLDHHADFAKHLKIGTLTREQLLADIPPEPMASFIRQTAQGRDIYLAFTRARDADLIMRGVQLQMVKNLRSSLKNAFPGVTPAVPLDLLLNYVIGAQLALIDWWITTRNDHTVEEVTLAIHQLQRAAIYHAYPT